MFGLGFGEIMIILVLALVLLGPQRLPDAAKTLGKAMRDFQKATSDVKEQFESAMYEDDRKVRVAPAPAESPQPAAPAVPPGGVPAATGAVLAASAENVPGLDAALAEPAPRPATVGGAAPAAAAATEAPKA